MIFTDNIISVDRITFSYAEEEEVARRVTLFRDFSLDIAQGSFTALLGHNGSGKSTLARMFNGMLLPDAGTVSVCGMVSSEEKNLLDIRRTVGLVFQNPDNQLVSTIVEEDVAFGPENLGMPPEEIRRRVDDALRAVDMYDYRLHATHKLSGGQKQRVAIAGILAMQPKCIVLDEPTAMLDPRGRHEVLHTVRRLNREQGITIVMITHYMEEVTFADRAVVLKEGQIVLDGAPREVFRRERELKAAGLDLPQPCELALRLNEAGIPVSGNPLTAGECARAVADSFHLA